ncbi:TAXI family TRAP transporter solute-binding subunit [Methanocella arvoryzae]|uniref:Predicted TRAP-type transport system, periplasmic component n=1 Tax=Methanocella arvoryzae (strain DSM 22066 / NBRC 105507 / MRE50) TaxID=351160 RepID=Q0W0M6_METAR|nr:TAXI family TRAP transporter solute-binding subunit [Methanocella arvoryzae]CAJ38067.1 predicted TRAP-type transport system, periplasmic component [Methanocella arvoryzae MRE50]
MYNYKKIVSVLVVLSVLLLSAVSLGCTTPVKQYTIATGGVAGTYYPIGSGIAQAANNASTGYNMAIEATGASVVNCRLLSNQSVDFATIQNDVAYAAVRGERDFEASGSLTMIKGVACLYPETIQIITLNSSGIKSVSDLKGKRVVMGDRGSGSWFNALEILNAYNLTENDVQPSSVKLAQAAEMMKNDQVDAAFWTGGAPTAAISELATTNDIYIVPISGPERDALMAASPFYASQTLPAGTYRSVDHDTETVTIMAMLVAHQDIPEDDVYNLLKAMYDSSNPISSYPHAVAKQITRENALKGMSIELHPGAKKYFDEQNILP